MLGALLLLAPLAQDAAWRLLPTPALCRAQPSPASEWIAPRGSHLVLEVPANVALAAPDRLPVETLLALLEDDARAAGVGLELLRPAPPILARGAASVLERALTLTRDLELAAEEREIEIEARLVALAPGKSGAAGGFAGSAHTASGGTLTLGTTRAVAFLATFDVEVASGSGIADPTLGTALVGHTLVCRAWRVDAGRGVFLAGRLDLAELVELERFDPGSRDLGELQLPRVRSVVVEFSGRVDSGQALSLQVRGADLDPPDWTLTLRATTRPDGGAGRTWRCADLSLLESQAPEPELPLPGAGLAPLFAARPARAALEPLTAAAVWAMAEGRSGRRFGSEGRAPLACAPGILIAPAAEGELWAEIDGLVAAAEAARTRTAELELRRGGLLVTLPVAEGRTALVLAGSERTWLLDYNVEIAPESWMAAPFLGRTLDGLVVQGQLAGETFSSSWWSAASETPVVVEPVASTHGRMQLARRSLRSGGAVARLGQPASAVPESAPAPGTQAGAAPEGAIALVLRERR